MAEKGIELLKKTPPSEAEKAVAATARTFGIPLIIGIEIIFLALLSLCFKLNQDLTVLSTSIAEKEATLAQMTELETLFRTTQNKLEAIATVKEAFCYPCALKTFKKITPPLINPTTFLLEGERLSFTAETSRGSSFALFIANLLDEEAVEEAALTSGTLSKEGRFTFAMEFLLRKEKLHRD